MPLRIRDYPDETSGSSEAQTPTGSTTDGQTTADNNSVIATTSTGDTSLSARTAQDTVNPQSPLSDLQDQYETAKIAYLRSIEPHGDLMETLIDLDDQPDLIPADRASQQRETVIKFAALIKISSELATLQGAGQAIEQNLKSCADRIRLVLANWSEGEQCDELSEIEMIDVLYAQYSLR
jgi:hypothetical protein